MMEVDGVTNRVPWLKWIDRLSIVAAVIGGVATLGLMVNVVVDVVGRFFFNSPLLGTLEMTQLAWMPTLISLGLGYALLRGEHIRVSLMTAPTGRRTQRVIEIASMASMLAVIVLLFWFGFERAVEATRISEKAISARWLEVWPFRWVVVVGLAVLLMQTLASLVRLFATRESHPVEGEEIALRVQHPVFDGHEQAYEGTGKADASTNSTAHGSALTSNGKPPVEVGEARTARRLTVSLIVIAATFGVLTLYLLVVPSSKLVVGAIVLLSMIALMLLKIPIGVAMTGTGVLGLYVLAGPNATMGTLKEVVFASFASWSLSVIPMFVLMGVALGRSGLMSNAYDSARKLLGWLPGGLAISTNFAGAGMAATSGSTIGIVYAVGRVSIPEMIRSGYKPSLAMASTAMAGSLGQVIPPSILLVIYAGVAGTPVGQQLLAGVVPGIIMGLIFAIVILLWALISPKSAPRSQSYSWSARLASLVHLIPVLIVMVVVLGGLYFGVFTATEAGAYGALIVLLLGLGAVLVRSKREKRRGSNIDSTGRAVGSYVSSTLMETVAAVAAIFLLIVGVHVLTRVVALSGLAQWVAAAVSEMGLGRVGFLLLLIVVYIILGLFLDTLAMMLLTIPLLIAPLQALDVSLVWFGVFLVILAEIGMVTPPLGLLSFVVHAVGESSTKGMGVPIKLNQVFKGVIPFIIGGLVLLLALIAWPELVLWLPGVSSAE